MSKPILDSSIIYYNKFNNTWYSEQTCAEFETENFCVSALKERFSTNFLKDNQEYTEILHNGKYITIPVYEYNKPLKE